MGKYNATDSVLPNGMIALKSSLGKEMFNSLSDNVNKNEKMVSFFKQQVNRTYCGPASMALVTNGMGTAYRVKVSYCKNNPQQVQEIAGTDDVITIDENDIVNDLDDRFFKEINIKKKGMTLEQIAILGMKMGYGTNTFFIDEKDLSKDIRNNLGKIARESNTTLFDSANSFRNFVSNFFQRPATGLICNYDMAKLGFVEYKGHFSPLAGYHSGSDMILVMDVWPETQPIWVKTELLYKAMCTVDQESQLTRGLLHVYELM